MNPQIIEAEAPDLAAGFGLLHASVSPGLWLSPHLQSCFPAQEGPGAAEVSPEEAPG